MTTSEFRCVFPEFDLIEDPQINANLDATKNRVDAAVLLANTNEAHGLLTADVLAASPAGQQARLISEEGKTTYLMRYRLIISQVVVGITVSGGPGPVNGF